MHNDQQQKAWKAPIGHVMIYLILGIIWMLLSDYIELKLGFLWPNLSYPETIKGIFYIMISAALMYLIIGHFIKKNTAYLSDLSVQAQLMNVLQSNQQEALLLAFNTNWTVVSSIGYDSGLGINEHIEPKRTHLNDLKPYIDWHDQLWAMLQQTKNDKQMTTEIQINSRWYEVQGVLINEGSALQLNVLVFRDKTGFKELLDLTQHLIAEKRNDASELQKYKDRLDGMSQKIEAIIHAAPYALTVHSRTADGGSKLVDANKKAEQTLGLKPVDFENFNLENILEFNHDKPTWADLLEYSLSTSQNIRYGYVKNTNRQDLLQTISQTVEYGEINYNITIYRDIGKIVNALSQQERLHDSSTQALNIIDTGIMFVDRKLQCNYVNKMMIDFLQIAPNNDCVNPFALLNFQCSLDLLGERIEEVFNSNETVNFYCQLLNWTDQWFTISLHPNSSIQQQTNNVIIAIAEDHSMVKPQEQKFINNALLGEESIRLKSVFIDNLSHEVRTPMNGIIGFIELLEMDIQCEEHLIYLKHIRNSTDHLLLILNKIMEYAQLESQQVELRPSWVDMAELQDRMISMAHNEMICQKKSNIELIYEPLVVSNERVLLDTQSFYRIFEQLLSNAIKFTDKGHVELKLSWDEERVTLRVSDSGIGVMPSLSDAIFLPFTSFGNPDGSVYASTGLGLAMVKGLVDLQNGSIELKSVKDKGTTVIIELPCKVSNTINTFDMGHFTVNLVDEKPNEPLIIKVKKVLLIEDKLDSHQLFKMHIRRLGLELITVSDGVTGIETFYESSNIDLVFCDINLSAINGFEVLAALRRIDPDIPVVACATYANNEERNRCNKAGFNDYLTKPILREDIMKILINSTQMQL